MADLTFEKRKVAFIKLGGLMCDVARAIEAPQWIDKEPYEKLSALITEAAQTNPWFVAGNVRLALQSLGISLASYNVEKWLEAYSDISETRTPKRVAVIMAGNIPMVGFHDMLSVLISGHHLVAKLSSDDNQLLPAVCDLLCAVEPMFRSRLSFVDGTVKDADVYIATGSDNTARYFEYYFKDKPHIIRRNRHAIAVLNGEENSYDLQALSKDIFHYFGLGCRNVSKIYLPQGYELTPLIEALKPRDAILNHNKYFNNYEYRKALLLVNRAAHFDNGGLLFVEDDRLTSAISVIHYSFYTSKESLEEKLKRVDEQLQCVVSQEGWFPSSFSFGTAQEPALWDYADGVDTLDFLLRRV